jgi:uncharacterized protein with PIN domain
MASRLEDRRKVELRRCPECGRELERWEVAGDEREVVVANVCRGCGTEYGEWVEKCDGPKGGI